MLDQDTGHTRHLMNRDIMDDFEIDDDHDDRPRYAPTASIDRRRCRPPCASSGFSTTLVAFLPGKRTFSSAA